MKKKSLLLIVSVMLLTLVFAFIGCSPKQTFTVEKGEIVDVGELGLGYLDFISTNYKDRTSGTTNEVPFLQFLSSQMTSFGYEAEGNDEVREGMPLAGANRYTYYNSADSNNRVNNYGYNMQFIKKAKTKSQGVVIVSTQYDNLYSFASAATGADGAYESGASTAALITLAQTLIDQELNYDVRFIFYGGGSFNWEGASDYLGKLSNSPEFDDVLLSIDIGQIIGGDNNFAYAIDKETDYGNLVNEIIKTNELDFEDVPKDKRIATGKLIEGGLYNYFHVGMLNNNIFMMNKGIPTLNIMSHNWKDKAYPSRTEMKGKENIYQTRADTYENMIDRVGNDEIKKDFNSIVNLLVQVIGENNQENLVTALSTAKDQMPSRMAQSDNTGLILNLCLKILLVIATIFILIRMRKIVTDKHDYYTKLLNEQKAMLDSTPIDVFGWDKENKKDDNAEVVEGEVIEPKDDDEDDIFKDL